MPDDYHFLALKDGASGLQLRPAVTPQYTDPAKYRPAVGLCEAIDAAMLLGMPLLLTGEPGTGKTQAARWLAHRLEAPLLRHDVKSTTAGRDLLYSFDEVARFRCASANEERAQIEFVTFSALGEAIIRTRGGQAALTARFDGSAIPAAAFSEGDTHRTASLLPGVAGFAARPPEHCVVLIDELDKAPRDTPNDLLAEIDNMAFEMPELGLRITADSNWRPIVIITSNSERALPDPFLRRCLFFDIPPPDRAEMAKIVAQSIEGIDAGSPLLKDAWNFYVALRSKPTLRKRPGTAEFLAWMDALVRLARLSPESRLSADAAAQFEPTLVCLAKSPEDLEIAKNQLRRQEWADADDHDGG